MPNVVASAIHTPRSVNWTSKSTGSGSRTFFVRVGYQRRVSVSNRSSVHTASAGGAPALVLATDGRSRYPRGQITARYQFTAPINSSRRTRDRRRLQPERLQQLLWQHRERPVIRADASDAP